jgi:hypothetical protein
MTEAEVQKLRDAGISDAVIVGLQKEEAGKDSPIQAVASDLPEIDPNSPSKVYTDAKAANVPTEGRSQTLLQTATEIAPVIGSGLVAAAPYAAGALALGGGSRLVSAAKTAADAYKTGVATAAETAQRQIALQEAKIAERMARASGKAAPIARPAGLTMPPTTYNVPISQTPNMPQGIRPATPVAPTMAPAMPAQAAQPGIIQRGMDIASQVRQHAAQRIIPVMGQAGQAMGQAAQQAGSMFGKGLSAAAPALRVGGMASNALYSGDLNSGEQAELERRRKMSPTITR